MKTVLIDTNILYVLAGINDHDKNVNASLLKNEIKKLEKYAISELSLVELYTHKGFTNEQRKQVIDYVESSDIEIIDSSPDIHACFVNQNKGLIEDAEILSKIRETKINLEAQTLRSCISIIVYIFYYFVYLYVKNDEKGCYTFQVNALLEGNLDLLLNESRRILDDYYTNNINPKNNIEDLIQPFLYTILLNYELSMQGILLSEVVEQKKKYTEDKSLPLHQLKEDLFKSQKGILCKKDLYWQKLEESVSFMKKFFENNGKENERNYISYYCHYAWLFFTQGKKFDKNNLIDSLFHWHDDQYTVYTLDEFLTETYKDSSQYEGLKALQTSIKVN